MYELNRNPVPVFVEEFIDWIGDSMQWNFLRNIKTRIYTHAWRWFWPKLRHLVATKIAWHPYGHSVGACTQTLLSIDTLTLTPKVTVSGQGQENFEISGAIFLANSHRTGARLRALMRVYDLRRFVQLQCRVLTPSNRGWVWRNGGCKTVDRFSQSRWHLACILNDYKINRWLI